MFDMLVAAPSFLKVMYYVFFVLMVFLMVIQFETVWYPHWQPMAPIQGKDSSSSMLQRPYQAVALQDAAHCDIHASLQGDLFHYYRTTFASHFSP